MAEPKSLYVSVNREVYKDNKTNLLNSQSAILKTEKHIENLKKISKEKVEYKEELHKLFGELASQLSNLLQTLPAPKIPNSVRTNKKKTKKKDEHEETNQDIDAELKEIQEKLNKLNQQA
ncbi:MAG: hypothetical protein ACP5D2_01925 [Candidatus Nanoarchaeia archaeon]